MKKGIFRKVLIAVPAALALLAGVIVTRPATFHYERSITIASPPEGVFAQVNDFHAWAGWSPYDKLDPQMKRTYEGPSAGSGAKYAWSGNHQVGEGAMTIERSDAPSQIVIRLDFVKPMEATNMATFTFAKAPEGTKVTWAMDGKNTFLGKAASLVLDMEKLVGSDFERGLVALKAQAEAASNASAHASNLAP